MRRHIAILTAAFCVTPVLGDVVCIPTQILVNQQTQPYDTPLDLDQNGTTDITLYAPVDCVAGCGIHVGASTGGGVVCRNGDVYASAVPFAAGRSIGPTTSFAPHAGLASGGGSTMITESGARLEPERRRAWQNPGDPQYLGIRFTKGDDVHYGWLRIQALGHLSVGVFAYAYETTPGAPILAGAGFEEVIPLPEPIQESPLPPPRHPIEEATAPNTPRPAIHTAVVPRGPTHPGLCIAIALAGLVCAMVLRRTSPMQFLR